MADVVFELRNEGRVGYAWNRNGAPDIGAVRAWGTNDGMYIDARSLVRKQWLVKCGFYLQLNDALEFFKTVLEQHGYTVQEATDGKREADRDDAGQS